VIATAAVFVPTSTLRSTESSSKPRTSEQDDDRVGYAGMSLDEIAELLGHSSTRMLEAHYRHRVRASSKQFSAPAEIPAFLINRPIRPSSIGPWRLEA
jgi:hypothetical protein